MERARFRSAGTRSWDLNAPPLPRERLIYLKPVLRVVGGAAFIAWSWVSTVLILGWFLEPVIKGAVGVVEVRHLISLLFAFGVTVAEFVTAEDNPDVYWIVLILLDASFTSMQTFLWLSEMVGARIVLNVFLYILLTVTAVTAGILVARLGELLLLGQRRRTTP